MQGYLSITFVIDTSDAILNLDRTALELNKLCRKLNVSAKVFPYTEGYRPNRKSLYFFTFMGEDHPGILGQISSILFRHHANIETIKLRTRGGWVFTQLLLDLSAVEDITILRNELRKVCEGMNLSMALQEEKTYRVNKKLVVFDMDSTLVIGETIVDIARHIGIEEQMREATERAMASDGVFADSLRMRTKLIAGVEERVLQEIAEKLQLTPGAENLVKRLQEKGLKVALISSGFSYFTDVVKRKLNLDYSFGNTLEIKDGKTTGRVVGKIIDGEGKWQIITDLCEELQIDLSEVVTVGDGSNDRAMLSRSGLGIGLESKEIASQVADGKVKVRDVEMILLLLGLSDSDIDSFFY